MLISKIFICSYCGGKAHEFHGLEGGVYISKPTAFSCPKGKDKDQDIPDVLLHNFVVVREVAKNEPPNRI